MMEYSNACDRSDNSDRVADELLAKNLLQSSNSFESKMSFIGFAVAAISTFGNGISIIGDTRGYFGSDEL